MKLLGSVPDSLWLPNWDIVFNVLNVWSGGELGYLILGVVPRQSFDPLEPVGTFDAAPSVVVMLAFRLVRYRSCIL